LGDKTQRNEQNPKRVQLISYHIEPASGVINILPLCGNLEFSPSRERLTG